MRISSLVSSSLFASMALGKNHKSGHNHHNKNELSHSSHVSVYELSSLSGETTPSVPENYALVHLADKFGISEHYKLGKGVDAQALMTFIESQYNLKDPEQDATRAKIVVAVDGVENAKDFFDNRAPSYNIEGENVGMFHKLPKLLSRAYDYETVALTDEIKLLTHQSQSEHSLISHFKFFNEKLLKIWQSFKTSTIGAHKDNQVKISEASTPLNLINDRFFIAELSELVHLKTSQLNEEDYVFIHLNSLLSIGKKTGFNSNTYKFSNKVLSDFLLGLSKEYDLTLFVSQSDHRAPLSNALEKRSRELSEIFSSNDLSKRSVGACFTSEESCQVSTSNCASHGLCSKVKSGCWSCVCSATFDKATQRTTNWVGADCSRQDISVQVNLFLWSGLGFLALLVGGIQLLVNVGSESLPGVLDAATSSKKNP